VISQKPAEILFWMFFTKRQPKTVKKISAHTKCTVLICQKISSRDTIPWLHSTRAEIVEQSMGVGPERE
jgi:hypothetical protein